MSTVPVPVPVPVPVMKNEAKRIAALRNLALLDTSGDPAFDAFAKLAAEVCDTPIALVGLIDESRQWFKASVGLPGLTEMPREITFCTHALASPEMLEITDATLDERFADNPAVTGPEHIRFYAGTPLIDRDGYALGTLCVVDRRPRTLRPDQRETLRMLGSALVTLIETRRGVKRESLEQVAMISTALERAAVPIAIVRLGAGDESATLVYVNRAFCVLFGYDATALIGRAPAILYGPATDDDKIARLRRDVASGADGSETVYLYTETGETLLVEIRDRAVDARHRIVSLRDLTHLHAAQQALQRSNARARSLVDNNGDAVFTLDGSGRCLDANAAATAIFGFDRTEFLGDGLARIDPDGEHRRDAVAKALREARMATFATAWSSQNDERIDVEAKVVPMNAGEAIEGAFLIVRDVTERSRLAAYMAEHAKRMHALHLVSSRRGSSYAEQIDAALAVVIEAFGMDYGYVGEIVGESFHVCNGVGDPIVETGSMVPLDQTYVRESLAFGDVVAIDDIADSSVRKDGVRLYADWHGYISAPLVVDGETIGAIGFVARTIVRFGTLDLDFIRLVAALVATTWERRSRDERLERLAHVDALTGLANRARFVTEFEGAIARARERDGALAIHFIDLDGFKSINDSAGHAVGDLALEEVARRIRVSLRDRADVAARLGGDEFVVVQTTVGKISDVESLARRLVDALAKPYVLAGAPLALSASVGVALFPDDGADVSTLLGRADEALYRAKTRGKRRFEIFSPI